MSLFSLFKYVDRTQTLLIAIPSNHDIKGSVRR